MKKFSELKVGDEFFSECKFSLDDLEKYLEFTKIKNIIYENKNDSKDKLIISGRAILGRMEGEFTRLNEIYGNLLIFYGMDGDPKWNNRHTRFLKPLYINENIKIRFKIADKSDINEHYGLLTIDFEGSKENGELVVISKRNLYQIKKEPLPSQQTA